MVIFEHIDDQFISYWHPKYECTENDEREYQRLVKQVEIEVAEKGTVSENTFESILNWKAARVKGAIDWDNISVYQLSIGKSFHLNDNEKINNLCCLPGIGVPVASTILHFLFPKSFPIMDVRTVEVLYYYKHIKRKSRDEKRYWPFREALLNINKSFSGWSLREIDRALFSFHKQNNYLFPVVKRKRINKDKYLDGCAT